MIQTGQTLVVDSGCDGAQPGARIKFGKIFTDACKRAFLLYLCAALFLTVC